jgi:hypothetical protein
MAFSITTTHGFRLERSERALGKNLPQRIGTVLWLPMLAMALMAFPVGVALGIARAAAIADGGAETTIASLAHFTPAAMFLGFASVFAAISFAIARILGELRDGGGRFQQATGRRVETLAMPVTGKLFIAGMAMAMMILLATVVLHVIAGAAIAGDNASALASAEQWGIWLEGVRRFGVALYLFSIALGLATIAQVLTFQSARIRALPHEAPVR